MYQKYLLEYIKNCGKIAFMSTNTTKSKGSKTSKKTSAAKTSGAVKVYKKIAKKNKALAVIIAAVVILLGLGWFFGGKPIIEIGAEGITLVQTEEPILYHIPEYLRGEYPPQTDYAELNGTGEGNTNEVVKETAKEPAETPASTSSSGKKTTSSKSGTKSSDPKADTGYAANNPLHLGNPTDAYADTKKNTNYLMIKPQYTLSYNTETLCPNWVAWHLDTSYMGSADRMDDFRPDDELPDGWYGVKKADYQYNKYGFDRGHVCPSADRTSTKEDNSMTFLMTNMVPQSPDNNRVIWMHFENYERQLANEGNELYIIAGPYGKGGTSSKGTFDEIPISLKSGETLHMNVPSHTWKVVLGIPNGENDLSRVTKNAIIIAINVPNQMGMGKTGDWEQFITTVDEIEAMTGYDLFELLPDDVEDYLEAQKYEYIK